MAKDLIVERKPVEDWLEHIRVADARISYLESRISAIRERLAGMGYDPSSQGRGSSHDAIPNGVATLQELEDEWNHRVADTQREVETVRELCAMPNIGRHVVWLRVFERRTWPQIAKAVSYSEKQAMRFAEGGIRDLYPYVPERFKRDAFPNAAPW